MERNGKNSVDLEIQDVLEELNCNQILSEEERIELKDHFLCEIENLTGIGLRDEEALLVAKKRFGVLEEVNMEYQKVKPRYDLMRYGIIGVVMFCMVKILMISVSHIVGFFWMISYYFDPNFAIQNIGFDVPLRIVLVIVFGLFAAKILSRRKFPNLISFWQFPIIYLLLEIVSRLIIFVFPPVMFNGSMILTIQYLTNNSYVNYISLVIILLIASYKMYKLKVIKMEYA